MRGYEPKLIAVRTPNCRIAGIAQTRRSLRDHIQHRLNVGWRAGDDAQDFTRCSLLFQRFLEFFEQPHVLDGDDSLVCKGLQKGNLFLGKRSNLGSTDRNSPDGNTLTHKRDCQPRPDTPKCFPDSAPDIRIVLFAPSRDVGNVYYLPVEYGAAARRTTANRSCLADTKHGRDNPVARYFPLHVALYAPDLSINGVT